MASTLPQSHLSSTRVKSKNKVARFDLVWKNMEYSSFKICQDFPRYTSRTYPRQKKLWPLLTLSPCHRKPSVGTTDFLISIILKAISPSKPLFIFLFLFLFYAYLLFYLSFIFLCFHSFFLSFLHTFFLNRGTKRLFLCIFPSFLVAFAFIDTKT